MTTPPDALAHDPRGQLGRTAGPVVRVLDRALTALLAVLVATALLVLVLATLGIRPRLEMSDSMAPTLHAGDLIWLRSAPAAEVRVGDIVAFRDAEHHRTLVHRVRTTRPDRFGRLVLVTRGDANTGTESWVVRRDAPLGRYAGLRVPVVGRLTAGLHGPAIALVALLSGLALAGLGLSAIWRR